MRLNRQLIELEYHLIRAYETKDMGTLDAWANADENERKDRLAVLTALRILAPVLAGSIGGSSKSERKAATSRANASQPRPNARRPRTPREKDDTTLDT